MRQVVLLAAVVGLVSGLGCGEKKGDAGSASPEANSSAAAATTPAPTASATPSATAEAPKPEMSAAAPQPSASAATAPASTTSATPATSAAPTTSAAAGPKTYECGGKGQKACPMQGWMKGVMANATSSGDGAKIASGLSYIAGKPPPGMGSWASIAADGASKAKAGDIDGAKASCKKCHDLYKEKYKNTMRDMPW
jgi:hypothetical protein